jgi:hypothetical protein
MEKIYIGARVSQRIKEKLKTVSRTRGEDEADFIRRAVLRELALCGVLSKEEKEALGIKR